MVTLSVLAPFAILAPVVGDPLQGPTVAESSIQHKCWSINHGCLWVSNHGFFLCVVLLLKILFSGFCADSSWDGIWFMMSWTARPSLKQCWISQQVYKWSSIIKGQSEQVWPSNQAFTPLSLPLLTCSWSIMGDGGFFNEGTSWVKTPYFLLLAFLFMLPPCDRGGRFWQSF